jgi:hypothetical protein
MTSGDHPIGLRKQSTSIRPRTQWCCLVVTQLVTQLVERCLGTEKLLLEVY